MKRGFTLIEMMVAVSIFAIAMLVGVGALLSLIEANKRAQAINAVVQNVNAAVEGMSRAIRVGTNYHCSTSAVDLSNIVVPSADSACGSGGGLLFAFEGSNGDYGDDNDQIVYRLNGTQIERSLCSGLAQSCSGGEKDGTWVALTAPEVSVDSLQFFLTGAIPGDAVQPRVLMIIHASADVPGGTTSFTVQSSVTERLLDI
jgi:prepilin-type N-terminal cleavage/methylation domain-containing protein